MQQYLLHSEIISGHLFKKGMRKTENKLQCMCKILNSDKVTSELRAISISAPLKQYDWLKFGSVKIQYLRSGYEHNE